MFVQIFDDACVFSVEPAAIVPTAPPPDAPRIARTPGFVVTVLPLAVVVGAGGLRPVPDVGSLRVRRS